MSVADVLNKQVANWNVLYVKLHNFHWFVKGEHFFTLHAKFEEFYNEAAQYVDELAERLLAIGEKPVATMREYLNIASIKEAEGNETAEQMVQAIIDDFSTIRAEIIEGIEVATSANDEVTGDMLLGIQASLDKHIWMLNAFLGK